VLTMAPCGQYVNSQQSAIAQDNLKQVNATPNQLGVYPIHLIGASLQQNHQWVYTLDVPL